MLSPTERRDSEEPSGSTRSAPILVASLVVKTRIALHGMGWHVIDGRPGSPHRHRSSYYRDGDPSYSSGHDLAVALIRDVTELYLAEATESEV